MIFFRRFARTRLVKTMQVIAAILSIGVSPFFLSACVGAIRPVESINDLSGDLPSEIQKFEIKEASLNVDGSVPVSDASLITSSNKKKQKKKRQATSIFSYPSRRPEKDPIWISEKLSYTITYLGLQAGDLVLEALPFKRINERKVYHIRARVLSSPVFGLFYRLNDTVESFIDYEGIFSHRFHVQLDESKQSRDQLELYDSEKKQTFYWSRWNHKVNGYSESKEFKPTQPFSQDSLSALYYLRSIPLPVGSVISFPVVSEGKPWEAVCTVLRKELMDGPKGKVQTIVIQPEMKLDGVVKKSGDSFLWLTDDDRRIPIKLEAKVRVGTISARLKEEEMGIPPT